MAKTKLQYGFVDDAKHTGYAGLMTSASDVTMEKARTYFAVLAGFSDAGLQYESVSTVEKSTTPASGTGRIEQKGTVIFEHLDSDGKYPVTIPGLKTSLIDKNAQNSAKVNDATVTAIQAALATLLGVAANRLRVTQNFINETRKQRAVH